MRGVKWLMVLGVAGCLGWAGREAAGQAAPAAPTYVGVERTIESIRQAWAKPGARPEPNADGWNALFDALLERPAGVRPGAGRGGPADGAEPDLRDLGRAGDGRLAAGGDRCGRSCGNGCGRGSAWPGPASG